MFSITFIIKHFFPNTLNERRRDPLHLLHRKHDDCYMSMMRAILMYSNRYYYPKGRSLPRPIKKLIIFLFRTYSVTV